jgi:hypothetical protein
MPFTTIKPVGQFTDINGNPLDGQVFFGQPNLDTIANPITVYWDAAGTQPVTQPVVTVGGYPMNGSTRSNVFVNADYSILVRNRNGFTVFSAPNLPFEDSSDNQYFLQAGSGAVQRTVQSKLRDVVSVLDFGADPTGGTDSTLAFQNALGSYATRRRVYVPAGTYLITNTLNMGIYKELIGEAPGTVILRFNSSDSECISGDGFSSIENLRLENITSPLGTKTAVSSYTPTTSNGWRNGMVRNVEIVDFYYGIGSSQGLVQGLMFQNVYERVRIYNANTAVLMGAGSNANTWINCEWWDCARGVHLNNVTTQDFIACGFEGCTAFDFVVEACNNIKFDTCYFEPARGGVFDDSTGTFVNCHSTNFVGLSTTFLTATNNSTVYLHDFNDYNVGGGIVTGQSYYQHDATSIVYGLNLTTRGGVQKLVGRSVDGVIRSITQTGDWIVTKYGNGLMTMDMNTDISTNTLIMTGATLTYSATLNLPDSFVDGNYVAQASIFFNGVAGFLLVDSPLITVRPKTATTLDIAARRPTSVGVDGYFYTIRCVGFWK